MFEIKVFCLADVIAKYTDITMLLFAVDVCDYMKCPEAQNPVCGDDKKTYPNECMMYWSACKQMKKIKVAHKGKCKKGT